MADTKETTGRGPSTQVTGSDQEQKANATNNVNSGRHRTYTYYSIMQFPNWSALKSFAKKIPYSAAAEAGNKAFEKYIDGELRD